MMNAILIALVVSAIIGGVYAVHRAGVRKERARQIKEQLEAEIEVIRETARINSKTDESIKQTASRFVRTSKPSNGGS